MQAKNIQWTPELVEEWLQIAALVDRALPSGLPTTNCSTRWEFRREWHELLWDLLDEDRPIPKFQPTTEQVGMWEEVNLRWYQLVEKSEDKKILWMRADGASWVKIAKKLHLTRQTIAIRYRKGLEELAQKLLSFYQKNS